MISNKNIPYYITSFILFIVLKFGYKFADTEDLTFLLKPTNKVVEFLTGMQCSFSQGAGYYYEQLNIIIDKSCSGFNFWLLCFLMLTFLFLKHTKTHLQKISVLSFSIIGAYIVTIGVNSARIFTSIIIQSQDFSTLYIEQKVLHQTIGIVTNLSFLVLIYILSERMLTNKEGDAKLK